MDKISSNKQQTKIWRPVEFKYIVYNIWDWAESHNAIESRHAIKKNKQITDEETMD